MTGPGQDRRRGLAADPAAPPIARHLPAPYRRTLDGRGEPLAEIVRSGRAQLRAALGALESVQRSRALAFFEDLEDGARLGALHDQAPWPGDTPDTLRARLKAVAALALSGAATAERMLRLVGIAAGADLRAAIGPRRTYAVALAEARLSGTTGPGQTRGVFVRHADGSAFAADVLTAPARLHRAGIRPAPGLGRGFAFGLHNPALASLPDLMQTEPPLGPDPVFEIAVSAPFGPFALIQRDLGRVVVVNRHLPAGGALRIDIARMRWEHLAGARTTTRGAAELHGTRHDLLAGIAAIADDSVFASAGADPSAGHALDLRPRGGVAFTGALVDPVDRDAPLPADAPIPMPSLLGEGLSRWRLAALDLSATTDVLRAPFRPVLQRAQISLSAVWVGRRPGEFALRLPPGALAPGADDAAQGHRADWLDRMVDRFRLAGCVRVPADLLADRDDIGVTDTEIALSEAARPVDALTLDLGLALATAARPRDALRLLTVTDLAASDTARPRDALRVDGGTDIVPAAVPAPRPRDALELTVAPDLTPSPQPVRPRDGLSILPDRLALTDAARPRDALEIGGAVEIEVTERLRPRDALRTERGR
ncbi:hypothetical protein [Rhodobaculum claviforme]|uniref:Uncharacterized protein n=1 Tax=Rhodobaculum claviforme TaxID=1549854 RepID=A0A934WEH7_9RHOB|nr:hypothetical protein [Rhodobaculum claviforme]MBK5926175.1 hypothetical protein [Rhodobaculum claviforme]